MGTPSNLANSRELSMSVWNGRVTTATLGIPLLSSAVMWAATAAVQPPQLPNPTSTPSQLLAKVRSSSRSSSALRPDELDPLR